MGLITRIFWSFTAVRTVLTTPIHDVDEITKGWTKLPPIAGGPRQEHSVVASDNAVWILGGTAGGNTGPTETVNTVEYYSLSDRAWHSAAPFFEPLNHLNAAAVGDDIFILGGLSAGDDWVAQGINMAYSPTSDTWQQRARMPKGTVRGSCAVGVYRDKIYLAGGMTYLDLTQQGAQDAVTTVTAYDVSTDSWETDLPPLPQPRQHVGGAVVGSTFYVLGGREDGQLKVHNTVYALDLENPRSGWRQMASVPTARGGLACTALQQKIYCFGGEGNPNSEDGVFEQVEVYDTTRDEWTSLAPMPVPRHGWGVATIGNTIFVPGGGIKEGTAATDYFDAFTP